MTWTTADGREIPVSELTGPHAINIIKFCFSQNRIPATVLREALDRGLFSQRGVLHTVEQRYAKYTATIFIVDALHAGVNPHFTLDSAAIAGRLPDVADFILAQDGYRSPEDMREASTQAEFEAEMDDLALLNTSESRAARYNSGKLPVGKITPEFIEGIAKLYSAGLQPDLIPMEFIEELSKVFTKGAAKYEADNWKKSINTNDHDKFVYDRLESLFRHYLESRKGELFDPEQVDGAEDIQATHYGAMAWNALVAMWYATKKLGV